MVTLSGTVTDKITGDPVENASIIAGKKFALTSEAGDYIIYDMPPGVYTISVLQRFYKTYVFTQTINGDLVMDIQMVRE